MLSGLRNTEPLPVSCLTYASALCLVYVGHSPDPIRSWPPCGKFQVRETEPHTRDLGSRSVTQLPVHPGWELSLSTCHPPATWRRRGFSFLPTTQRWTFGISVLWTVTTFLTLTRSGKEVPVVSCFHFLSAQWKSNTIWNRASRTIQRLLQKHEMNQVLGTAN